jgi:hypothetical protein
MNTVPTEVLQTPKKREIEDGLLIAEYTLPQERFCRHPQVKQEAGSERQPRSVPQVEQQSQGGLHLVASHATVLLLAYVSVIYDPIAR